MKNFNRHYELQGKHAVLSASKYHWINYTDEKFELNYRTQLQAQRGTDLHALASEAIRLGVKLPQGTKTINAYVNDAIGFRMTPEQVLCYSINAFGTADAISFRDGVLRIHDLKTGLTKTSFKQLEVYVAYFCLEYDIKPATISIEVRIYQNDEVLIHTPDLEDIMHIMQRTIDFDARITQLRLEELS